MKCKKIQLLKIGHINFVVINKQQNLNVGGGGIV